MLVWALLGLAACANFKLGPTPPQDAVMPSPIAWWQQFQDPAMDALVAQALTANASIRAGQASLQQARALRDARYASSLPSVGLRGSATRTASESNDGATYLNTGFDARWEMDLFGANRRNIEASEGETQATQAMLRSVQLSVAAEVALAYIQLRGQQAQLEIAQRNLASQEETLQITRWRAQAGLVTSLEVEQAQSATAQTAAQIPSLRTQLAKNRHSLAILTGQRPLALDEVLSAQAPIPSFQIDPAQPIPANTLRQRPDVRAAEHRVRAALARLGAAQAAVYPSFNLGGSLSLSALTLSGLTGGAALAGSLVNSVSLPVINHGSVRKQILAQEAALEQARVAYESTVLGALRDVEDALISLKNDQEKLAFVELSATAANNAALLAQNRYASGLIDFQIVLQTQRTLLSAQDTVANLKTDISAHHVRLIKALGGGWSPTEPPHSPDVPGATPATAPLNP